MSFRVDNLNQNMLKSFTIIIFLLASLTCIAQKRILVGKEAKREGLFRVDGKVIDILTGEPLVGVNIFLETQKKGATTDKYGRFMLVLLKGDYDAKVSFVGYKTFELPFSVRGNGLIKIRLSEELLELDEVVIAAIGADENVQSTDIGKSTISIETIEALPPFVGEVDVLKSIILLPGVSTVGEASSGFNVRGGSSDQNLILLGGATLYNPSHLFGFFSSFNSDVINDVTLYKGGIPAKYGGRGSSVLDLSFKTGNFNHWSGKASIGLISTKIAVDGPIIKDKISLIAAGRTSYSNWILNSINDADISNSSASFYDVNGILNYQLNRKNDFSYSFYRSFDDFQFATDTSFLWSNQNHVLKWNHEFNENFLLNLSLTRSGYNFSIKNKIGFNNFELKSGIIDQGASIGLTYELGEKNTISVGMQSKELRLNPGELTPLNSESSVSAKTVEEEKGLELGVYIQHDIDITSQISLTYGLRYSQFRYLGSNTVFEYEAFTPRREENIINQLNFTNNETIIMFDGYEPRFALRWAMSASSSLKIGFNRMFQYIHLISNTTTIAPTDIWKLSDPHIAPEEVTQYSIGLFKNFRNNSIETSVEAYYKDQNNIVEYKDGAELILSDHLETELLNGIGKSYGLEFYLKKKTGRLTGWVGYTWSRSKRQVIGAYPEEIINKGQWFPSNFDKPHDLTAVAEYWLGSKVKFSSVFTYSTGRPVTFPTAKFRYRNALVAFYDNRNINRAPDYHRVDISFTFHFSSNKRALKGDWVFSIYNLYGRKNAFSVFFDDVSGQPPQAYKLSVLGIPFPSLSYSFKF